MLDINGRHLGFGQGVTIICPDEGAENHAYNGRYGTIREIMAPEYIVVRFYERREEVIFSQTELLVDIPHQRKLVRVEKTE
jgi:hypothetical protein